MKLVATADLHYDVARSIEPARAIAEEISELRADALLILGDVGGLDPDIVSDGLHLFDRFAGRKFFVAGNHDIWAPPGEDSLHRLEQTLPALCREAGFHPLDIEPALVEGVGLVGSIGWYDYSFRHPELDVPDRFYREKVAPGAASRLEQYHHLLQDTSDIPEPAMRIGTRWMDGEHVRLPLSDGDFTRYLLGKFTEHLEAMASQCDVMVVGLHHLPFAEPMPKAHEPNWAFASAFMGSEQFGQAILAQPKIRYALIGHSHFASRIQRQHIECINVGCTYVKKRYEIIEIEG